LQTILKAVIVSIKTLLSMYRQLFFHSNMITYTNIHSLLDARQCRPSQFTSPQPVKPELESEPSSSPHVQHKQCTYIVKSPCVPCQIHSVLQVVTLMLDTDVLPTKHNHILFHLKEAKSSPIPCLSNDYINVNE